jgi:gas vesicle protein
MGVGALAGLLLAPRTGEDTLTYLRAGSRKGLDYLNQQAEQLRESAQGIMERGKELMGCQCGTVEASVKTGQQASQENTQAL